jgi:hypothetical protein
MDPFAYLLCEDLIAFLSETCVDDCVRFAGATLIFQLDAEA